VIFGAALRQAKTLCFLASLAILIAKFDQVFGRQDVGQITSHNSRQNDHRVRRDLLY